MQFAPKKMIAGTCEVSMVRKKEKGRRKKEEGRRKKEEGRRKKEEGRRKKEEGRRKKERRWVWCVKQRRVVGQDRVIG
jgi:hypothetical protein